jgi:hypothetical protein
MLCHAHEDMCIQYRLSLHIICSNLCTAHLCTALENILYCVAATLQDESYQGTRMHASAVGLHARARMFNTDFRCISSADSAQ